MLYNAHMVYMVFDLVVHDMKLKNVQLKLKPHQIISICLVLVRYRYVQLLLSLIY